MLTVVLITSNTVAASAITEMLADTGIFRLVYCPPAAATIHEILRGMRAKDPEILLLDLGEWDRVSAILAQIEGSAPRALRIGFRGGWTAAEQGVYEKAGIHEMLREPFSPGDLERVAYEGLHRAYPVTNRNILAFLPAKAGSGCSTVALQTAASLANDFGRKVLLLEADRRSSVFSIMLNLENRRGLSSALQDVGEMTELDWQQYRQTAFGMDLLTANPATRGPLPTWAEYYQLLRFVENKYEFVAADLPEVVNAATAELAKHARGVFLVCTPELPSLKMAAYRCAELEECEIPQERIHIVLNRYESRGLNAKEAEGALGRPVFATLPNDYAQTRAAIMESRLVAADSRFGKGCKALAEKLGGLLEGTLKPGRFSLLEKLGKMME